MRAAHALTLFPGSVRPEGGGPHLPHQKADPPQ